MLVSPLFFVCEVLACPSEMLHCSCKKKKTYVRFWGFLRYSVCYVALFCFCLLSSFLFLFFSFFGREQILPEWLVFRRFSSFLKCCRWCGLSSEYYVRTRFCFFFFLVRFLVPVYWRFIVLVLVRTCCSVWYGSGGRLCSCERNVIRFP